MPMTRAPTAWRARTNSRWLAGKEGSRKTTSMGMARGSICYFPPMRILLASSEVAPFAKAGGLGDVAAALPRQLAAAGHDVRVVMPMYARVREHGRTFVEVA